MQVFMLVLWPPRQNTTNGRKSSNDDPETQLERVRRIVALVFQSDYEVEAWIRQREQRAIEKDWQHFENWDWQQRDPKHDPIWDWQQFLEDEILPDDFWD